MLSIDEAIANAREVAAIQRNNDKLNKTLGVISPYYKADCIKCAEEHEQLAEWLEELKAYRENQHRSLRHMYEKGYDKAIDDFVEKLKARSIKVSTVKNHTYLKAVGTNEIDKIAEQLKAGVENES